MAAETGIPSVYLDYQLSHGRATKKTQAPLIEKLRGKNSQNRSWTDSIKSVRSSVAERRSQTDSNEPLDVQKHLDALQKAMKVTSQQTLKERLDLISRQLGLTTQVQDQKISLGTDVFHVDVLLGEGGSITSVKLANQGDVVDCPDLKDILKRGDFKEFIEHLQGLQSIYQVTSDEKLKSKTFLALQALEKDLNQLAQFQNSISGVANYIHKCPLGIMLPRLAGKPMKLIYFVSPYDLLDKKSLTAHPLTVEAITDNFLGQCVTVCIESVPESAPPNKLQTMPLMNVSKTQDGKSLPSFSPVSKINSMMLPARFVLVLPQSIPVSTQLLQKIASHTNQEIHTDAETQSLRSLILESFSGGKVKDSRKLCVSLPDQQHIYFLDGLNGGSQDQQGVMVSRIPFTHPTHVPQILNLMRQQLLFNIVIASCLRPGAQKDTTNSIVFEVTAVSLQQLTIVFEHPAYDSMITVDIDLTDITNLKCRVACSNTDETLCSDEAISRVFQRCMSIPVTLRWLISKGRGQLDKLKEAALAEERERTEKALLMKHLQQQQSKLISTNLPTKGRPPPQPPHPPPLPPPPSYSHHHHSSMPHSQTQVSSNGQTGMHPMLAEARSIMTGLEEFRTMTENNSRQGSDGILMSPDPDAAPHPLLTNLLDEEKLNLSGQSEVHDSPMLSRLLDDNISVATTVIPMNCKPNPPSSAKRPRKRRSQSDFSGPSPKHRVSDNDSSDRLSSLGSSMDLDLGQGLLDQSLPSTPTVMGSMTPTHGSSSHPHRHPMLSHAANATRPQGNVIDLTEDSLVGESSLKKLADSVDKHFIHKDVKAEPDLSMLLNEAEAPSRIPNILQNSPSGSKNENASTSLEGFLKGSGEVGRAKDFDPSDASVHNSTTFSKLSSLLLASSDSPPPVLSAPPHQVSSSFLSDKLGTDKTFGAGMGKMVSNSALLHEGQPSPASLRKGALRQSASVELPNEKQSITGIFEKFDMSRQQQQNVKMEVTNNELKSQPAEGKVSLKLRVGPLKQQNSVKPVVKTFHSVDEAELTYGKANNIGTFDFKSDEDDDDPFMQFSDNRYVYSSSPTRLQISANKQKRVNDSTVSQKSDKTKKKDKSSGNTTKRKREKDVSKREKKRKKTEHIFQESVYRTVENDTKADFKLKIRVAKKPVSDKSVFSDGKVQSYEISKKTLPSPVDKPVAIKSEVKEAVPVVNDSAKEKDAVVASGNTHKSSVSSTKSFATVHKPSPKSSNSKTVQGSSLSNKTDPKLVTKATIRLKPLTMPNSGSTVNISQSGPKSSSTTPGGTSKGERRGSTSATPPATDKRSAALNSLLERRGSSSNLVDRRHVSQSSSSTSSSTTTSSASVTVTTSTPITTTTSANLSLSSILPNAPTVSKIASLPRIPKLSSTSTASINRTSSLDPASGSSPTTAGTKSNNSYTVGPAGRPLSGATPGPGGRPPGGNTSFSYNSNRPSAPGGGNNRQNFGTNRPSGPSHRQSGPQRPTGPRSHNPGGGNLPMGGSSHKGGPNPANSHKSSGNFTNNSVVKSNIGSSNTNSNVPQKAFGGGAKTNSNIGSKMGNNFLGQKPNISGSNAVGGQRHIIQNAHAGNSAKMPNTSSSVNRSPNTSSVTKSPSSGKSPNISNSNRSPSLSSSSKSPNISAANKSPNISGVNRSPNISSSGPGRSPNINPSRSPNISNIASRPSHNSSPSSKSSVSSSHKQSPNSTKPASVNKTPTIVNAMKFQSSSTCQRPANSMPVAKSVSKTTVVPSSISTSSPNQQPAMSKPTSVSQASPSVSTKHSSSSTPTTSSSSHPAGESNSSSSSASQKPSAPPPQTTSITSSTSSHTTSSTSASSLVVKSSTCDPSEPSLGTKGSSKVSSAGQDTPKPALSEKASVSTSSTPTTPRSADSNKSKFSFPSSRGRKNSLSAIVDKLKHNAVGSVSDTVSAATSGQSDVSGSTLSDTRKTASVPGSIHKEESSRTADQQKPSLTSKGESVPNHVLSSSDNSSPRDTQVKNSAESNSSSLSKVPQTDRDTARKGILVNKSHGSDSNSLSDKRQNVYKSSDSEHEHGPSRCEESSESGKEDASRSNSDQLKSASPDIRPHVNRQKEKPTPLKIPTPPIPSSPVPNQSPAIISSIPSSPAASPFQPQQSPVSIKSGSPLIVPSISSSGKSQRDSDDPVFKIPSVKPSGDQSEEDSKVAEMLGQSVDSKTSNADAVISKPAKDNHDNTSSDDRPSHNCEKRSASSKPLPSPLSDISSPENGLIIDDEESPRLNAKILPDKTSSSKGGLASSKPQISPKSTVEDSSAGVAAPSGDKSGSSQNSLDLSSSVAASPKTSRPPSAKSPALAKNPSGASTPKDSDSPCVIDDDLMDEALGFGN